MPAKKKQPSFEENLERLADIVSQAESGETPLEQAIALYKEGLAIADICTKTLTHYEEEILCLQKNALGAYEVSAGFEGCED
ncbi:MAG: exodeoxyribonuclease VII small subunit [Defluviitaleaceae bacterium]|nr:exodeoxyribonuclease VII small subunit [Defluviitaleaceae bacterium]